MYIYVSEYWPSLLGTGGVSDLFFEFPQFYPGKTPAYPLVRQITYWSMTDLCDGDDDDVEHEDGEERCTGCAHILKVALEAHEAEVVNVTKGEEVTDFCHFVTLGQQMHSLDSDEEEHEDRGDDQHDNSPAEDGPHSGKSCGIDGSCSSEVSELCWKKESR